LSDNSLPPIVRRIIIGIGPDLTVTVDETTVVPSTQQTKQWHAYVRKRALAVQGNSTVQQLVAFIRALVFIPDGGFVDSDARWAWQGWAESESFRFADPAGQEIIDWLTHPHTWLGEQAIPPTIPRILDLAIKRVEAIEELNDDDWWLWVHSLFVLHTPGDPTVIMPTPLKLPLESLTYRQAAATRRLADDRDSQGQRDELAALRKSLMDHQATGLSPYKIGTTTEEGRRFLELKGVSLNAERRQITNTIANAIRKQRLAKK